MKDTRKVLLEDDETEKDRKLYVLKLVCLVLFISTITCFIGMILIGHQRDSSNLRVEQIQDEAVERGHAIWEGVDRNVTDFRWKE